MNFSIFHILALTAFAAIQLAVPDTDLAVFGTLAFLVIGIMSVMVMGVVAPRDASAQINFKTLTLGGVCVGLFKLSLINLLALISVQVMQPWITKPLHRKWEIGRPKFFLHIADSLDIVRSELELADGNFDVSNIDFPCNCFLGFTYSVFSNYGGGQAGYSSVKLVLNTNEEGTLIIEQLENEWTPQSAMLEDRRMRVKFFEIETHGSMLTIKAETFLEDFEGEITESCFETFTISNRTRDNDTMHTKPPAPLFLEPLIAPASR